MIWFLAIPALWFVGKKAFWIYALDLTLKQQRHMRIDISPGDASQIGPIDGSELPDLTRQLEEQGFVCLGHLLSRMDYEPEKPVLPAPIPDPNQSLASAMPKTTVTTETSGFARIFAHPTHGCYATLVSVVAVSRFAPELNKPDSVNVAPFRTVILSVSGYNDDSWGFATHNREVDGFSLLHRHPRNLSHRLVGAPTRQLMETHLAEREDIAARAGVSWDKSPSLERYLDYEERGVRHIKSVYQRATTSGVAMHLLTYRLKKHERWMGELA